MARLGLVLASGRARPLASTRIAVLQVLPLLEAAGYPAVFLHEPAQATEQPQLEGLVERALSAGVQALLFQKVHGPAVLAQVRRAQAAGLKVLSLVCDRVLPEMAAQCDHTVVVTELLRQLHPPELHGRISVVHDGIEHPEHQSRPPSRGRGGWWRPLLGVLVSGRPPPSYGLLGLPPAWAQWRCVSAYPDGGLERLRLYRSVSAGQAPQRQLAYWATSLLHPGVQHLRWSEQGVYDELCQADIGLIPTPAETQPEPPRPPMWQLKSENRLTLMMSVGLPVIAGPVKSYLEVIDSGRNGYLARSRADWQRALQALRDPAHRAQMGAQARVDVSERFSRRRQAERLIEVLKGVLS